jgi:peptide/nickel transport system permease protein
MTDQTTELQPTPVNPQPEIPVTVKPEQGESPFYYVKKRFFRNKPAVFGMYYIAFCTILALLGYLIMPDDTPNANDSALQIKSQPPVFKCTMLRKRRNQEIENVNFFFKIFNGQPTAYDILPITEYRIDETNMDVFVRVYGDASKEEEHSMVDAVLPLYVGNSKKLGAETGEINNEDGNFVIQGNTITYLDINENPQKISKEELIKQFKEDCIRSRTYWLGTDASGRDMLSRLLFGARIALGIGFVSVLISMLVGLTLGSVAGFFGGWVDAFMMWIMTVVWSIPSIMLVIAIRFAANAISHSFGVPLDGITIAFIAVGLTTWVEIARVVRGQIIGIREKQFVEAAQALGIKDNRIIINHILPNILGPLIVVLASNFASAILTEAGLSFLGLGVQPPMPSWGTMINEGFTVITSPNSFHLWFYPSLSISLLVLAFNLFGNGLRDAYDPTGKG